MTMSKHLLKALVIIFMSVSWMVAVAQNPATEQKPTKSTDAAVFIANPNPLYFDDTYLASQSLKTLTFFNAGDQNLVISSGVFSGPFMTNNSFPITVAPGATFNQVILFKPFNLGLIEGTVTYTSNDPMNPTLQVSLIGTCINTPINGWEWLYTGFNYINMDIEFPEGQDQIGYIAGQNTTQNGLGIVLKTTNGGDSWTQVSTPGIFGLTNLAFPTLQTGYCVGWSNKVLKTTNGGTTWTETVVAANIYYIHSIAFKDANNGVIIGVNSQGNAFAYATSNGGASWTLGTGNLGAEDVSYAGGNTYYSAGYEYVSKSTNGGLTWTTVYSQGALLTGVYFYDESYGIAAGDYGQVITTWNGGQTWESDAIFDWLLHKPFIWDYDTAYVVGTPEYVYKTTNAGLNWNSDFEGNWQKAFYTITFTDNYTGFISGSGGIVCRKKPATVLAPMISASPNPVEFDVTFVGSSAQQTLTVQNTGSAPLNVTNITSTNPVFTVNLTSFTVQPGQSQNITVTFAPTAAGYVQGTLQIANNSATNPYPVAVNGTGMVPGPSPIFIANPNPLYWDDTYIASQSQQTLTFFNAGNAPLIITSGVFDGPFETYNSFPITVAPGTTFNQVIHFKPFQLGLIEGSVTYYSNDPINPIQTVSLIGTCINTPINGWEWIYTGYNFILTDIEFPEGQNMIGYTGGQSVTYNGLGIMLKTTDGGDTWNPITQPGIAGVERFSFPTLQVGYAAGWSDQILKTTDGGQTWQNLNVVSNVFYYSSIEFKDANNGIIIAKMSSGPQKTLYTSNGGVTWTEGTGNQAFEDVTWAGGDTWYATGYEKICKSTNNGATWTTVYTQGALLLGADFLTPEFGIAAGDYGQVLTTYNGGQTWEQDIILDILFHKPFIWDYDTAYVVGTPEYIYKTTNAGQNWISDFNGNWQKALYAVTFTNNYTGFVCGGSNGIVLRKKPTGIMYDPPTNFQANVSGNSVNMSWTAPTQANLLGYNVYRDNVKINPTPVSGTTYVDNGLQPATYIYAVSAVYSGGESLKTPVVQVNIAGTTGKIHGFVRDAATNYSIEYAIVVATNADNGAQTSGTIFGSYYSMLLSPGTYNISCHATGYMPAYATGIQVIAGQNVGHTFYLTQSDELTGIGEVASDEMMIYPNPATDKVTISGSGIKEVNIYNMTGLLVYTSVAEKGAIEVTGLKSGVYMVKATAAEGRVFTGKLVIR